MVATDSAVASRVGADVLALGGNAVDAAAAATLALGVVNPVSSGIGGGGFALVWIAKERKVYAYDFREVAPVELGPDDFRVDGKIDPQRSRVGGLAVGVPGEVAGLHLLMSNHGRLGWRQVVAPAIRLANGFSVEWFFANVASHTKVPAGANYRRLAQLVAPGGAPRRAHDVAKRPDLAATLSRIAARGRDGFYRGPVALDLVATVRRGGGVMNAADLSSYRVVERAPLWGQWKGLNVATMPLPSSGGVVLLELLGILDQSAQDLARLGAGSSAAFHVIAEIQKHGFADRSRYLGDDQVARDLAGRMLAPSRLAAMAQRINPATVQPHDSYGTVAGASAAGDDGGTSHLCVIDREGNAVALTSTVNGHFGSMLVTKSGVVLNNQIDDFTLEPGAVNMFGLKQSELNLVAPGKRPLSSMSPTLVFEGDRVVACVGGSGGPRIISGVFQVLLNLFAFGMDAEAAVAAPRVHHQWEPDLLQVDLSMARDVIDALERRGHRTTPGRAEGAVQLIRVWPDGRRDAASDPRKGGLPAIESQK